MSSESVKKKEFHFGSSDRESVLQATCLKPHYSLRQQLILSFGLSAVTTLTLVIVLGCVLTMRAGVIVKEQAENLVRERVKENLCTSSSMVSETLSKVFEYLEGSLQLFVEGTRDRIVGYPNDGYEDDRHVPFRNMETGNNVYPIVAPDAVPLDFQMDLNVNGSNWEEHTQNRFPYREDVRFSTRSGNFRFQGMCDPSATEPSKPYYFPNCTDANNDLSTGGVLSPTNHTGSLHQKSAELMVLAKALYEADQAITTVGMYFFNQGAGATVRYPGVAVTLQWNYSSMGCDWMKQTNPHTGRAYGNSEDIGRCHPFGETVDYRAYNPNERPFFGQFVSDPDRVFIEFQRGYLPILMIGRTVLDRR
jgi:hypothetical protein